MKSKFETVGAIDRSLGGGGTWRQGGGGTWSPNLSSVFNDNSKSKSIIMTINYNSQFHLGGGGTW